MNSRIPKRNAAWLVAAGASLALLGGCERRESDGRDPAQGVTGWVAQTRERTAEASDAAASAAADARAAAGQIASDANARVGDAAITAAINARLARDRDLSPLAIDVDTRDGRVTLRGSAPDPRARDRAAVVAAAIGGVASVDNRLVVAR